MRDGREITETTPFFRVQVPPEIHAKAFEGHMETLPVLEIG